MTPSESAIFENLTLRAVCNAILRRRKAIRYHTKSFSIERGVDRKGGVAFERLDLAIESFEGDRFHFTLWEDSSAWVYLDHRETRKSPLRKVRLHLMLWDEKPTDIVKSVEATLNARVDVDVVRAIWGAPC